MNKNLPAMFDTDIMLVMGTEWELCRVKHEGIDGHVLKLRFGDEMLVVGLFNSPERIDIAKWIVMRAAQFAHEGKK